MLLIGSHAGTFSGEMVKDFSAKQDNTTTNATAERILREASRAS